MALRVLLADESPTIKKVFQLALQDYAVEVKSVNIGLDVKNVVESFQPDIVFADILLQKQNGYEVCTELKSNPNTQATPVILMWSGFMDMDEQKFSSAQADGRIEKPFDVQSLRDLVQQHVPKTQAQTLGQYLNFPTMPEFKDEPRPESTDAPEEENNVISMGPPPQPDESQEMSEVPVFPETPDLPDETTDIPEIPEPPAANPPVDPKDDVPWDMDSFDPITVGGVEEVDETGFTAVSMLKKQADENSMVTTNNEPSGDTSPWVSQDLGRFNLGQEVSDDTPPVSYVIPDPPAESKDVYVDEYQDNQGGLTLEEPAYADSQLPADDLQIEDVIDPELYNDPLDEPIPGFQRKSTGKVTKEDIEQYIYEACQRSLEDVMREVLPAVAREIIQKEVDKILKS